MADIMMKQAQAVVAAALKKAEEIGAKMNIAVVNAGAISRHSSAWTRPGWVASMSR